MYLQGNILLISTAVDLYNCVTVILKGYSGFNTNSPELNKRVPQNAMTNIRDKVWPEKIIPFQINPSLGKRDCMNNLNSQYIRVHKPLPYKCALVWQDNRISSPNNVRAHVAQAYYRLRLFRVHLLNSYLLEQVCIYIFIKRF